MSKQSAGELRSNLSQFIGTTAYHQFSPFFPKVVLTDGALYLAENAGAFWLMDLVAPQLSRINDVFVLIRLVTEPKNRALLEMTDANGSDEKIFYAHKIEFTDFPLDRLELYAGRQDDLWVIMLPSEY
jgi:hypothetical protein